MALYLKNESLKDFQNFIFQSFALPDDRLFSIPDILNNVQRFAMRSLKGIRKDDQKKLTYNLIISLSWSLALANRMHIDAEEILWKRFPAACSYCGKSPCVCKKIKIQKRVKLSKNKFKRPKNLALFQQMFSEIYLPNSRSLTEAGIHLAEEVGELTEAVLTFLGEHKNSQFKEVQDEFADYISCIFGVANSAEIDIAKELEKIYYKNCHICHKENCTCNFSFVSKFIS